MILAQVLITRPNRATMPPSSSESEADGYELPPEARCTWCAVCFFQKWVSWWVLLTCFINSSCLWQYIKCSQSRHHLYSMRATCVIHMVKSKMQVVPNTRERVLEYRSLYTPPAARNNVQTANCQLPKCVSSFSLTNWNFFLETAKTYPLFVIIIITYGKKKKNWHQSIRGIGD